MELDNLIEHILGISKSAKYSCQQSTDTTKNLPIIIINKRNTTMAKYQYTVQGADYEVEIVEIADNIANVTVNGVPFEVELKKALKPTTRPIQQVTAPVQKPVAAPAPAAAPAAAAPAAAPGTGTKIEAPLPGTITEVKVNVGDKVKKGDTIVVLEAMKMQNNIEAENDGEITSVLVKQGDSVMEGTVLATIA